MQMEPSTKIHRRHFEEDGISTEDVQYVYVPEGGLMLLICTKCRLIETHCLHLKNSWNKEETQLTCDLCGIDGT
jgi:hypothetical protein